MCKISIDRGRDERYNNYSNRGSHQRGGAGSGESGGSRGERGGANYDQERRTSESMSQLSLEGKFAIKFF